MNERSIDLYEKLVRLQWLLHRNHLRVHAQGGPIADPTRGQGRIFAMLKLQDGISTRDLSYLLGIRVSSLNELLAKMEKAGYIQREPSEADRRVMLVKLTEKGQREQQAEWDPSDFFACLSEEEQRTFGEYLDRIVASVATDFDEYADNRTREWWAHGGREHMGHQQFDRLRTMGPPSLGDFDPRDGWEDPMFGHAHKPHPNPPRPPSGPHGDQPDDE